MAASKAQRAITAERRKQAVAMRLSGSNLDQIVTVLGYASRAAASVDIKRAMETAVVEQSRSVEVYREEELQRLDLLLSEAWSILKREHITVSHGRVVRDDMDQTIPDVGPVLAAMDRILKIQERRAKLLGLDAPQRHEVVSMDAIDAAIASLSAELGRGQTGEAARAEATAGA